jgi:fido (protein-threonine AMPylation protein)
MRDDPYVYPGTSVLQNHFNQRSKEALAALEQAETLKALAALQISPVQGQFDFAHLREIHRRIFEKVYPFAGQERTINLTKPERVLDGHSVEYADFARVPVRAGYHLADLCDRDWSGLKDMSRPADMEAFAKKVIDLWQVHPLREGNTRTVMTFMHQFVESRDFPLDKELLRTNAAFVRDALVIGTMGETRHLTRILTDARQRALARAIEEAGASLAQR